MDLKKIKDIVKIIDESSIDHFEYDHNGEKILLKKSTTAFYDMTRSESTEAKFINDEITAHKKILTINNEDVKSDIEKQYILSPMVGTFYVASAPDKEPFITIGEHVNEKTVVCIIEAMKLYNEIEAECTGKITDILVQNGQLVEYGQPLFAVDNI